MPEAAYQKDGQHIDAPADRRYPVSAQRDIDVIPEPAGKGNMPAAPEFLDPPGKIRTVKIPSAADSQQISHADGDIRVAGKITVELEGIEESCQHAGQARITLRRPENRVHIAAQTVRDDHFFKEAQHNPLHPFREQTAVIARTHVQLREEFLRPLDRPRHNLREEQNVGQIGAAAGDSFFGLPLPQVDIRIVADKLEGIIGNTIKK